MNLEAILIISILSLLVICTLANAFHWKRKYGDAMEAEMLNMLMFERFDKGSLCLSLFEDYTHAGLDKQKFREIFSLAFTRDLRKNPKDLERALHVLVQFEVFYGDGIFGSDERLNILRYVIDQNKNEISSVYNNAMQNIKDQNYRISVNLRVKAVLVRYSIQIPLIPEVQGY